jgi:hypothetical protein
MFSSFLQKFYKGSWGFFSCFVAFVIVLVIEFDFGPLPFLLVLISLTGSQAEAQQCVSFPSDTFHLV